MNLCFASLPAALLRVHGKAAFYFQISSIFCSASFYTDALCISGGMKVVGGKARGKEATRKAKT
jgi:hypothetical protein